MKQHNGFLLLESIVALSMLTLFVTLTLPFCITEIEKIITEKKQTTLHQHLFEQSLLIPQTTFRTKNISITGHYDGEEWNLCAKNATQTICTK